MRDEGLRTVVGDQPLGVEAELVEGALLELLDAHPLLGAGHLVAVHRADQLVVLAPEVAEGGAHGHQLLLAPPPRLLHGGALVGREHDRALEPVEHLAHGGRDGLRGAALPQQPLAALGGAGAGLALGLRRAQQRVGAPVQRPRPLLRGPQGQRASISACRASRAASASRSRSAVSGSSSVTSSAAASRASSSARPARSASRAAVAVASERSSRSASPRAARACEPCWPSSSATAARVASDSCSFARATSTA